MNSEEKCSQVADRIRKNLENGITLDSDVVHYIDSTFSNPTLKELQDILEDESNCDRDPLMDLLFFPDEKIQHELEKMLEDFQLEKKDEDCILELLGREPFLVNMQLPGNRGSMDLEFSREVAPGFIARLHIHKHLDEKLREAIGRHTDPGAGIGYKVKIRNSRFSPGNEKIQLLCDVFSKIRPQSHDFDTCFEFALSLLGELGDEKDMFQALMAKKRFFLRSLQKAKKLETQLQKNNLETLLYQGKRVILIDQADARKKMLIIDRISRAVYGQTEYFEELHPDGDNIEMRSDQDIQDIINRLS